MRSLDTDNTVRPAWMVLAGSEQSVRMFLANFLMGRTALLEEGYHHRRGGTKFQLLKSAGYQAHTRKMPGGAVSTVYLPSLFSVDPGMVEENIEFILMTTAKWRASQQFDMAEARRFVTDHELVINLEREYPRRTTPPTENELMDLVPEAMSFMMYLDRRIYYPMPPNYLFGLQLLIRCLNEGLARRNDPRSYRSSYEEHDLETVGLPPGLCFRTNQKEFGTILAGEVQKWHGSNQ